MQPQSPNSNYDFIMNGGARPKKNWLPNLGLPRPVRFGVAAMIILIVILIIYGLAGGKNKNSSSLGDLMARAQEISRASALINQDSQDSNLQALATTVSTSLTSQEKQLNNYLTSAGQKINSKTLSADQNSATDSQFQTATQNNNLSSVYSSYLKDNLSLYKNELSEQYSKTSNQQLKSILSGAYDSTQTILGSL